MDGSTCVIAWYSCDQCGHFWSARLRNGRPEPQPQDISVQQSDTLAGFVDELPGTQPGR